MVAPFAERVKAPNQKAQSQEKKQSDIKKVKEYQRPPGSRSARPRGAEGKSGEREKITGEPPGEKSLQILKQE